MPELTTDLPKHYDPTEVEPKISALWVDADIAAAVPDDRPAAQRYVIMMPLPNVTGALHMGHAMDNVMQDLLTRWHRMRGDNTLWMPGTDHAGIATQAVVEKRLKELEGLTRYDVGREGLVERIWQWKDQFQQRIVDQQRRMGCSCDWARQRFTMDAVCARAVRHAFFRMFNDGLIFRGKRLVNWDVFLQTSVSDDEVYHEPVPGHFWHLRYPISDPKPGEPEFVVVATTRPETMLGDTAVAVHPDPARALSDQLEKIDTALAEGIEQSNNNLIEQRDALEERRKTLLPQLIMLRDMANRGCHVRLPLLDRPIPLICDEWAKPELGSGCVKITPAHDANDYQVWRRHHTEIEIVNILNTDGTLNDHAGPYAGLDRYEARTKIVSDLDQRGLLAQTEDRLIDIGHSDRSKTPIEPFLSDQWFVLMGDRPDGVVMGKDTAKTHRSAGLVQAAIDAVETGHVTIHPARYTKTYVDWLSEKRDWPISRQLWWGHRIPIWSKQTDWGKAELAQVVSLCGKSSALRVHFPEREESFGVNADGTLCAKVKPEKNEPCIIDSCLLSDEPALIAQLEAQGFNRDPDVLDTWFSSALWPFSTLGWPDPETAQVDAGQRALGRGDTHDDCLNYYYPGSCLVTGRDIITLWVARMVLAGLYLQGEVPFSDVFIHANILDGKGERMSKSKGNGIDPVDIINRYGTDAMRYVLCDMQTGSQDIRLPVVAICPSCSHHNDLAKGKHGASIFTYLCDKCRTEFDVLGTMPSTPAATLISERFDVGRSFCTKLWNSARFALMNLPDAGSSQSSDEQFDYDALLAEDQWILDQLNQTIVQVQQELEHYNPSAALNKARDFFWGSLCDWYLEIIKSRLQADDQRSKMIAQHVLAYCLDQTLRLLHPIIPFITEHLWQKLNQQVPERGLSFAPAPSAHYLAVAAWPQPVEQLNNPALSQLFTDLQQVTRAIREIRASSAITPRRLLEASLQTSDADAKRIEPYFEMIKRLAGLSSLDVASAIARKPGSANAVVGRATVFVHDVIDEDAERTRLTQQLAKIEDEVAKCQKKLDNPKFTMKAPPAVVAEQRARLEDYEQQRQSIRASLAALSSSS